MKEFNQMILGNSTPAAFAAAMFFAILTAVAMWSFRVKKRDPLSPRTPYKFSLGFFFADNIRRIVGTLIFIFLCVRVSQFWIGPEYVVYFSICIGLISDQLALFALKIKDAIMAFIDKKLNKAKNIEP